MLYVIEPAFFLLLKGVMVKKLICFEEGVRITRIRNAEM